ncbi:MAG TPA: hypothetical protein VGQ95_01500 [Chthoniobacterales bacterium]|nr:hypothetical protein [Chthoniobacterales bacterium]
MPAISLVVCLYKERDVVERLLHETSGVYDDLVVVHDGPERGSGSGIKDQTAEIEETPPAINFSELSANSALPDGYTAPSGSPKPGSIHQLVMQYNGRFFEGPRCFQQEPHWPFSWWQAKNDWILRLDADEFPSRELIEWLHRFRDSPEPKNDISGYTCIWPLWDGRRAVTRRWPDGRIFLFHRQRVRFFGMVEQVPIPDTCYQPIELILNHQPKRKSYGVLNILFREQAYNWRRVIAKSLIGKPTDLACWRWTLNEWPEFWCNLRRHPLRHSLVSLLRFPVHQFRGMLAVGQVPLISECLNPALHHFMLGLRVFVEKRKQGPKNQ